MPVRIRLVDVDNARTPIFEMERVLSFADPMARVEHAFICKGPVFPAPGEYRLQLSVGGELLRELRLHVRLHPVGGAVDR